MAWTLNQTNELERRFKRYEKKHRRELKAVFDNLDTYFQSLNSGINPLQIKHGFLQPELLGVVAIDQKGGGPSLAETRLYVYPEVETQTLHVITLGDKRSQPSDLATCRAFVSERRTNPQDADEEEPLH